MTRLTHRIILLVTNFHYLFPFHSLIKYMNENVKPASVRVTSLVEKRTTRSCGFKADYVGFSIPDK